VGPLPRRPRVAREDVLILSRKRGLYSTRRLVEVARARGRRVRVIDALRCTVLIAPGGLELLHEGRVVREATVVIPRIGASITRQGLAVLHQLELMDIPVLNAPPSIARSRDKLLAMQLLARAGLDVPRTAMAHPGVEVESLVAAVGGLPVVVKLLKGTQGVGVMLASSMEEVRSYLGTFHELGEDVVLQEFVAESAGRDVRALVVGDRVVAAMRRRAGGGEFRSNLHRGGSGEGLTLAPAWEALALRAARAVGLEVAGVDLLEGRGGPRVMELNSSPGLEGIESSTGVDVAAAIIDHALAFAQRVRPAAAPPPGA